MNKLITDITANITASALTARSRFQQRLADETGANTVEYIMILGVMALIVATIFLAPSGLRDKVLCLGNNIKEQVSAAAAGRAAKATAC
jgi:Flp pilus assembly pilin Flp